MHQAVTTMIAGISLVLAPVGLARGAGIAAAGSIAQARRLIEAKDYAAAMVVLEDLLLEAEAGDKPAIVDLLRQSYAEMARQAHLAGRERDAAHYRDNLAILDQSRPATISPDSTKPSAKQKPSPPAGPKPSAGATTDVAAAANVQPAPRLAKPSTINPAPNSAPDPFPEPARLPEPVQLPDPAKLPKPGSSGATSPRSAPPSSLPSNLAGLAAAPVRSTDGPDRDAEDAKRADAPPAAARLAPSAPASTSQSGTPQTAGPKQRPALPTPEEADRLFSAKQYTEAGRRYAALAHADRLPPNRKNHWAYCRMVDVAQRMNARPRTSQEWDEIEIEITSIQRLAPSLWYGEYLRSKFAEVRKGQPRAKADNLIARASAPQERRNRGENQSQNRRLPRESGNSSTASPVQPETPTAPAATCPAVPPYGADRPTKLPGAESLPRAKYAQKADDEPRSEPSGVRAANNSQPPRDSEIVRAGAEPSAPAGIKWQVHETANFRILHCDARLAVAAGEAAESARADQAKRWGSPALQRPWTPRCEIHLFPTGQAFAQATGQAENSPGFSTMVSNGNRVTARRTALRADHPQLLTAILPHEVTHVVLADMFTNQQIPRWADEGMAVLAEPSAEQNLRAAELLEPLETGRIIEVNQLMSMDYPDAKDWSLYYAQSVSLTRFLVEQGTPETFVRFMRDLNRTGIETALRSTYHIDSFTELQDRWLAYARQRLATLKQARRDPSAQPSATALK